MSAVRIDEAYCKGCGLCVWVCPRECLEVTDELNELGVYPARPIEGAKCIACGRCAAMCPEAAIEIVVDQASYACQQT